VLIWKFPVVFAGQFRFINYDRVKDEVTEELDQRVDAGLLA